jgi:hypothetical protein
VTKDSHAGAQVVKELRHNRNSEVIHSNPIELTLAVPGEGQSFALISRVFGESQIFPPSQVPELTFFNNESLEISQTRC